VEDIQGQAEWLTRINLTIASKLARMIRLSNGHVVKLQDEQIAMRLAEQIFIIDQPELHALFREFLEEALKESNNDSQKSSQKNKAIKNNSQGYYRGVKVQ